MARKKKQLTKTLPTIVDSTQTFNYSGKVSISFQRGNKTISTKTYHNAGRTPLFKFLCNCLAGIYNEQNRPCKIKLFNYTGNKTPTQFDWEDNDDFVKLISASPFVTCNAAPVVKAVFKTDNTNEIDHWETTYHFKINEAYISNDTIKAIGIYGSIGHSDQDDALAYYLLKSTGEDSWDPISFDGVVGSYSIIIDWTMTVSNKVNEG